MYLVPEGETLGTKSGKDYPKMRQFWEKHRLTGDNTKERPYANMQPRLTTKSNVFKVHMIVQTLRNTVSNMDTPHPRDIWEVSIVNRLMEEIKRIVQAEILRKSNDESEQKFSVTEVQEMIRATELETRNSMATEIWEDVVVQVQTALEPELRKQIESEMWVEFEAELRRRQES